MNHFSKLLDPRRGSLEFLIYDQSVRFIGGKLGWGGGGDTGESCGAEPLPGGILCFLHVGHPPGVRELLDM